MLVRAEALLLVLVAALPWEGLLAYPTESVSAVKLLGVLLFGAWLVRALVRAEPLRVSPALALGGAARRSPSGSRCCSPPTRPTASFDALRYALFIVFFFLVLQLTHDATDVRRIVRVMVLSSTLARPPGASTASSPSGSTAPPGRSRTRTTSPT